MRKTKIATTLLADCFGCHRSFLDIDEHLTGLLEHIEFSRSPLTDIKHCSLCAIDLIESGVCATQKTCMCCAFPPHKKTQ